MREVVPAVPLVSVGTIRDLEHQELRFDDNTEDAGQELLSDVGSWVCLHSFRES